MADLTTDSAGAPRLRGARDPASGACHFPFRPLSTDGSLRPCTEIALSDRGILYTWTRFAGRFYGQVDLPEAVRIQTELGEGPHDIGAPYRLDIAPDGAGWRFVRD
ncbi:hypothetical protein [Ruixingdingia sedimenti]|uniref:Uncharacterized protein n=1 Tax=Ruixingdingia sedimenti TaxID=3073604 RepID=A0ABU1F8I9_9RHOB|nr:hypothetical protein [Xinfangfangia sp. LG-4]MDR5653181.1 hypothetical protein [Xinfangfangia sp. LG-4]